MRTSPIAYLQPPDYANDTTSHTQSTTILPAPLPLCYPESSMERTGIIHHDSRLLAPASSIYSTGDSSVYDTVKQYKTGKQRISVVEMHQSQSQQVTQTYAQTPTNSSVPVSVIPASFDKSPAVSFDGAREASMHTFPTEVDDSNNSLMLRMSKRVKSRSTESYPGRFPVSDGLEYSNLATAEMNFRERGTTSVRPFSVLLGFVLLTMVLMGRRWGVELYSFWDSYVLISRVLVLGFGLKYTYSLCFSLLVERKRSKTRRIVFLWANNETIIPWRGLSYSSEWSGEHETTR
jgi:hypothetical protein